jgi:hypothetical protein
MANVNPSELARLFVKSGDGTAATYVQVALINDISGLGEEADERVITSLGDTHVVRRLSHVPDFGEVNVSGFYDPADSDHTKLTTVSSTEYEWRVQTSDGDSTAVKYNFDFDGNVIGWELGDMGVDGDGVSFDTTIRRTTTITKAVHS